METMIGKINIEPTWRQMVSLTVQTLMENPDEKLPALATLNQIADLAQIVTDFVKLPIGGEIRRTKEGIEIAEKLADGEFKLSRIKIKE